MRVPAFAFKLLLAKLMRHTTVEYAKYGVTVVPK